MHINVEDIKNNLDTIKHFVLEKERTICSVLRELELHPNYFHTHASNYLDDTELVGKIIRTSKLNIKRERQKKNG